MHILAQRCVRGLLRASRPLWYPAAQRVASVPVNPGRVAVIACHWLGDSLWARQAVIALRSHWPEAELHVFCKPFAATLWHDLVPANRIHPTSVVVSDRRRERIGWRTLIAEARRCRVYAFDALIDLSGNRYSAAFARFVGPRWSIGPGHELDPLYSRALVDAERLGRHLSQKPFRIIEPVLGRFVWTGTVDPPPPAGVPADLLQALGLAPAVAYAVLAPGAGWARKRWPVDAFAEVAARLAADGWQVVATGARGERDACAAVARPAEGRGAVHTGPVDELNTLLASAGAFVGNDSGPAHLAAAHGVPTVALFTGETDPAQYAPLGPRVTVVETGPGVTPASVVAALPSASSQEPCAAARVVL